MMRLIRYTLILLCFSFRTHAQKFLSIPGEILSSVTSADEKWLAISSMDSVYIIRSHDLGIEKKWAHRRELPVLLGFHPVNTNILLMQVQHIASSQFSAGLINYGMSWKDILENYRATDRKYNEQPADSILLWDISRQAVANSSSGNFYFAFGNSNDRFVGLLNKVFPYQYQGKTRYGSSGAELISQEKEFNKTSNFSKTCRQLLLSPAQDLFAASWRDGYKNDTLWFSFTIQDFITHETVFQVDRIPDMPTDLCFSKDGNLLAIAAKWNENETASIRIIDTRSRRQIGEIPATGKTNDLRFSADGKELYYRSERDDWFAWNIAEARTSQKIWSNLTSLLRIHAALYLKDQLLVVGESWSPAVGIPKPSDKTYGIESISMSDMAVFSKTDEASREQYADSSAYQMLLNDVPTNNETAVLHFSSDKKIFTSVEKNILQVWNAGRRKKLLQLSFEHDIKAFPDRTGMNILVVEKKIQKSYSEYILHLLNMANSSKTTSAAIEPGENSMEGSDHHCDCVPDPAETHTWYCTDGSEKIWKLSGKDFTMKSLAQTPGTTLGRLQVSSSGKIFALGENKDKRTDIWELDKENSARRIIHSSDKENMTLVGGDLWLWNYRGDSTIEVWKGNKLANKISFPGFVEQVDAGPGQQDAVVQYEVKGRDHIRRFEAGLAQELQNTELIGSRFYMLKQDELLAEDNSFSSYMENGTMAIPWSVPTPQVLDNINFDVSPTGRFILFNNRIIDLKETEQWDIGKYSTAVLLEDSNRLSWLEIHRTGSYGNEQGGFTLIKRRQGSKDTLKSKTWISEPKTGSIFLFQHDRIILSPDRNWAFSYNMNSLLEKDKIKPAPMIWNLKLMTGKTIQGLPESFGAEFTADNQRLLFTTVDINDKDFTTTRKVYEYTIGTQKLAIFTDKKGTKLPLATREGVWVNRYSVGYWQADTDTAKPVKSYHTREYLETALYSAEAGKILAGSASGNLFIWEKDGSATPLVMLPVHSGKVERMMLRGKRLFTLSSNGEIGITDTRSNKSLGLVKTLLVDDEIRVAMHTPGNYYRVDPDLMAYLHFVKSGEVYPLSSFELQGNRPDKVYESIGIADTAFITALRLSWVARVRRAGFDPGKLNETANRPIINWDREKLPLITTDSLLRVQFSVSDKEGKLQKLYLRVNGVPVGGRKGMPLQKGPAKIDLDPSVKLNEGLNSINLTAVNESGQESPEESFDIRYQPAEKRKRRLVFAGIGVSAYADTSWNLRYAAKDAQDIAGNLRYYADSVKTITLVNGSATRAAILALKEELKQTNTDDIVVLSFAGHGLIEKGKGFFFAPYDMDFKQPSVNGISMETIEDLLDDIPARRRLLLLDACHSGEEWSNDSSGASLPEGVTALKPRGGIVTSTGPSKSATSRMSYLLMKELFSDFSRGNGAFMISAAASNEYAFEGLKGKENGVFTRSFLEALQELGSKGSTWSRKENSIRVRDLRKLIYQKVSALTNGLQNPTSRQENGWWNWSF